MIDERFGTHSVNREFFFYQHFVVINTNGPISSHIAVNTAENNSCGTIQHTERLYIGNRCNTARLARMPGNSVQDEHVMIPMRKARAIQKKRNDFYCKRVVFVFEQKPPFENAVDKGEFFRRVVGGTIPDGNSGTKFRSEIEMMAPTTKKAPPSDGIAERTFADAGGAEQKQGVDGMWSIVAHSKK
jgi:hypothetical protein